jgi:hypothetical protein
VCHFLYSGIGVSRTIAKRAEVQVTFTKAAKLTVCWPPLNTKNFSFTSDNSEPLY